MPRFTVRVELHNAKDQDYETLHKQMEKRGFSRTISNSNGTYQLPPGEYSIIEDVDKSVILDKADAAAKATGRKSAILVTEGSRTWLRLEDAD